jgi:predicted Zn-ribbon and HTH transcriptional regulator
VRYTNNTYRAELIRELLSRSSEPLTINEIYMRIGFRKMKGSTQAARDTIQRMEDVERIPSEGARRGVRWRLISRTPSQE